ncbi:hypothetical protein MYX76_12770 [Desulfobacterota bacterium AH_259_B03_O07]|nr:hypothetical protein [Desulfobacterota bacterium AH_259_B03_O07]
MGKISIVILFTVLSVGLVMALSSQANAQLEEDDEVCSVGFECVPGDPEAMCPMGLICEQECDDDDGDGLPDCEVKECELDGIEDGDDIDDGICVQETLEDPCGECPCKYFDVPFDSAIWPEPEVDAVSPICFLFSGLTELSIERRPPDSLNEPLLRCEIEIPIGEFAGITTLAISEEQIIPCFDCLTEYAAGLSVVLLISPPIDLSSCNVP